MANTLREKIKDWEELYPVPPWLGWGGGLHMLISMSVILFLFLLNCNILGPEEEPWLRVWWVPIESAEVAPGQIGIYLHAYAHPDQEITWGSIQEWPGVTWEWDGILEAGQVLQLPLVFMEGEPFRAQLWAMTESLGPDTLHYEHIPALAQTRE